MIDGHGDDAYKYGQKISVNFSSNVYNRVDHSKLADYLHQKMECIRSYPEPEPYSLERKLASQLCLSEKEVCVTNGATEAIYLIAQAFRNMNSAILVPTFSEYADACRLHEHKIHLIQTLEQLPEEIKLVWLCNPNNPTGEVREKNMLKAYIESHPDCYFIMDQSYEYFTLSHLFSAKEAAEYPNVILLHSMTKRFAVPGLRLGYITANESLLNIIRKQRMPWSVNQLAIEAGLYLLGSPEGYDIDMISLLKEKERLCKALVSIGEISVCASDTHYMLVQLHTGCAAALKEYLATEHGILIRDASNFEGLNKHFFRIATQTQEENDKLIKGIKQWMSLY